MPVAKVNVGRVIPDNTMRSLDGSQDTTSWALLTTSDIQSTDDPNNLETSKAMSGREFQFRGGTPSGSGLSNPNDGCLYNFTLKDPDTGATIDPKAGSIIGVEFYFKFGTNVPDTQNDQFHCAVWNGTQGSFGGYKQDNSAKRVSAGTYSNTQVSSHTNSAGNVYLVQTGAFDNAGGASAVMGPVQTTAFDDAATPARSAARTMNTAQTLSGTFQIALVFAGDVDVEVYYRLVLPPSSPF